jgi:DNA repair exonuclease SbcCD ATPase subunit
MKTIDEKVDYLMRKVETYDRALNEFKEIKSTLNDSAENTRKSKNLVQRAFDSINVHQNDIDSLSKLCQQISQEIERGFKHLEGCILALSLKVNSLDTETNKRISEMRDNLSQEAESYLNLDHLKQIQEDADILFVNFAKMISNVHNNYFDVEDHIRKIDELCQSSSGKITSIQKEISRIQNSIFRHRIGEAI